MNEWLNEWSEWVSEWSESNIRNAFMAKFFQAYFVVGRMYACIKRWFVFNGFGLQ